MFRYEQKYIINKFQYNELKTILTNVIVRDIHADENGEYFIRSLYFDDMYGSAYNDKMDGVYKRRKYRVRIYNCESNVINLECKIKEGAYIKKESLRLSLEEYEKILNHDVNFLLEKRSQIANEFVIDYKTKLLRPRVIVDYEREPYVFDAGNVRITFDKNLRGARSENNIFDAGITTYDIYDSNEYIMEIKFTGYLPKRVEEIFKTRNLTQTAASKYCLCVDKINGL